MDYNKKLIFILANILIPMIYVYGIGSNFQSMKFSLKALKLDFCVYSFIDNSRHLKILQYHPTVIGTTINKIIDDA